MVVLDSLAQSDLLQYRSRSFQRATRTDFRMRPSAARSLWSRVCWWPRRLRYHWRCTGHDLCHRRGVPRSRPTVLSFSHMAQLWNCHGVVGGIRRTRVCCDRKDSSRRIREGCHAVQDRKCAFRQTDWRETSERSWHRPAGNGQRSNVSTTSRSELKPGHSLGRTLTTSSKQTEKTFSYSTRYRDTVKQVL